jgi:hypothetical protein
LLEQYITEIKEEITVELSEEPLTPYLPFGLSTWGR